MILMFALGQKMHWAGPGDGICKGSTVADPEIFVDGEKKYSIYIFYA
jgi:hypothetical protein